MSEKEKALKRFEEWEKYALEDEQIILIAIKENGPPNQICLHAEQMGEKYLKGYLAYQKVSPVKTHQLDKLVLECKKYDKNFSKIEEEAILLSDYYTETRYPGDVTQFSLKEAETAYKMAKNIRKIVLSLI